MPDMKTGMPPCRRLSLCFLEDQAMATITTVTCRASHLPSEQVGVAERQRAAPRKPAETAACTCADSMQKLSRREPRTGT